VNAIDVLFWAGAKGAVIIALAAAVALALRNWPAAVRHVVWTFAISAQLLLPVLILIVPVRAIGLGPIGPVLSLAESRLLAPTAPLSRTTRGVAATPPTPSVEPSNVTALQAVADTIPDKGTPLARLLLLAWLTGAALVAIRFSVGTIGVSRDMRRARRPIPRDWIVLAGQIQEAMQMRRTNVQLAATESVVPYTWGILAPAICLPSDADNWTTERLRIVLVHEMAHVQRFDGLTELMAQLALVLFWFNPILWPAVRRMRTEREHACDDRVLLDGIKPSTYVQELVAMMKSLSGGAPAPAFAAIAMARRSQFESRMLAVLNGRANRRPLSRRTFATLSGITALIIVGLASVRPAIAGQRNDRARLAFSAPVKDAVIAAATKLRDSSDWKKSDFEDAVRDCHRNSEKGRIAYCEVRTVDVAGLTNRVSFDGGYLDGVIFKTSASHGASARALVRGQAVSEEEARTVAQGVHLIASNGTVHSDGPGRRNSVLWSVLYEITLPPASTVQAKVENGQISLDGFTGVADLDAVNGPIEVFGSSGNIHGRTRNGPLMVGLAGKQWDGEGLDLESKNGPIYLAIPESYSAHLITGTVNGPLRVDYPMQLKRISKRNIEADIGGGGTTIRVTTENGPADIRR
jgi:beta-lactamase regulating signal transducer with metallopeptidase domain